MRLIVAGLLLLSPAFAHGRRVDREYRAEARRARAEMRHERSRALREARRAQQENRRERRQWLVNFGTARRTPGRSHRSRDR